MKPTSLMALTLLAAIASSSVLAEQSGKDVYAKVCVTCHASGLAGAPRFGNAGDWGPRAAGGTAALYQSALNGTAKGMPAKGGNTALSDAEAKAAVDYMLASVKESSKKAEAKKDESKTGAAPSTAAALPVGDAAAAGAAVAATAPADVNSFNRLLKPAAKRNLPPPEDGIHDPANDGTHALQPPLTAFGALPKSNAGNRINWVEALNQKLLNPRYDRLDPKAEPIVMDLNIVREVKGSMPDVVYLSALV